MAEQTSGTYQFTMPMDEVLIECFERIGITIDAVSARQVRSFQRSVNLVFVDWSNIGVNLWAVDLQQQAITAGMNQFTMPAGSIDILEATFTPTGGNTAGTMTAISRTDYALLPNPALQAQVNQYWVSKLMPLPVVHLYPTASASGTMNYYRVRQLQDVNALYQLPEAPYLWTEALCASTAAKLAEKFAPARLQEKIGQAAKAFNLASGENRERVPTTMALDMGGWG